MLYIIVDYFPTLFVWLIQKKNAINGIGSADIVSFDIIDTFLFIM